MLDVPSPWQRWLPALRSVQMGQCARPLSVERQVQSSPPQTEDLHKHTHTQTLRNTLPTDEYAVCSLDS